MSTEPVTPTVLQEGERAEETARLAELRRVREGEYREALRELHARHQEERRALSQELLELAVGRKAIQDQLCTDLISSPLPDLGPGCHTLTPEQQRKLSAELPRADRCVHVVKHLLDRGNERALDSRIATVVELGEEEVASRLKYLKKLGREENRRSSQHQDGTSSSTACAALNGNEGPGEGDEENPCCAERLLKASQQREEKKQALLKELLPARSELNAEVQCLLEVLDERELRKAYEHRIRVEDPREIKAHERTLAAKRAGLWRFVSKRKVEATRRLVEVTAEDLTAHVDSELGYPKLPESYEEIKNLLQIEKNPIFSKALQEWNRKGEIFSLEVNSLKNQVASVKNEVYQLIGFFSVFQGVVLTAVSQSSLLHCHNKWSPIALSVLASVISTFGVIQKLNQIKDLQGNIDAVELAIPAAVLVRQRLQELGPNGIDFVQLDAEIYNYWSRKSKLSKDRRVAWLYFVPVILTLVAFGVLFPVSFWRILCKPGAPPAQ